MLSCLIETRGYSSRPGVRYKTGQIEKERRTETCHQRRKGDERNESRSGRQDGGWVRRWGTGNPRVNGPTTTQGKSSEMHTHTHTLSLCVSLSFVSVCPVRMLLLHLFVVFLVCPLIFRYFFGLNVLSVRLTSNVNVAPALLKKYTFPFFPLARIGANWRNGSCSNQYML